MVSYVGGTSGGGGGGGGARVLPALSGSVFFFPRAASFPDQRLVIEPRRGVSKIFTNQDDVVPILHLLKRFQKMA